MGETSAFDTRQRLDLLARIVREFLPARPANDGARPRVLDVGGFPGLLAQSLASTHDVFTADCEKGGLDRYVRASGEALPFAPGTFDAVAASDVLEHVPPEARDKFLDETAAATRGWLFLGGPFRSPAVDAAEESLADLIRCATGRADPWIEEHRRCGLPDLADARRRLEALGFFTAAGPNGSLFSWFALQSLKAVFHAAPDAFGAFAPINDLYVSLCGDADHAPPTYRHLVAAHRDRAKVESLAGSGGARIGVGFFGPGQSPPSDAPECAELIRRAAEAFRRLAAGLRSEAAREPAARLERDYTARLETLLERQEARQAGLDREIEALRARLAAIESSRLVRLWRRLRGF